MSDTECTRYCLLFWFDGERNWSILNAVSISKPRKDPERYEEGEKVLAKFKGKTYPAIIIGMEEFKDDLKESAMKLDTLMKSNLDVKAIVKEMGLSFVQGKENTDLDVKNVTKPDSKKKPPHAVKKKQSQKVKKKQSQLVKKKQSQMVKKKQSQQRSLPRR